MPVIKENNGTFTARFYYTDYTGARKQKKKRGFRLKRDAEQFEREYLLTVAGSPSMPFKSLCALFLEDKHTNAKLITFETYRKLLDAFVIPRFGEMPVNAITPAMLRKWQNDLKSAQKPGGGNYSPAYLNNIVMATSSVFAFAVRFYNLPQNPMTVAGNTAGHKVKSMNFWTREEFNTFLASFDPSVPFRVAFLTLYYTGVRIGELLALTVGDFDREAGTLNIDKTVHIIAGERIVTAPKTKKAVRVITLPPFLISELITQSGRIYGTDPARLLFPWGDTTIQKLMRDHIEKTGIRKIRVHDLRHSHASLLIELGFSALLVAERLGHENVSTTLNIYAHLFPSKQSEVAERLQAIHDTENSK